jgi:hypothetical protein
MNESLNESLQDAIQRTETFQHKYRGHGLTTQSDVLEFTLNLLTNVLKNQLVILQTLTNMRKQENSRETVEKS